MVRLFVALLAVAVTAACAEDKPNTPVPVTPAIQPTPQLRLLLPPEVPAVPGRETNIYFDNIILTPNSAMYLYDVDCPRGAQQVDRYTYTPKPEEAGVYPWSIRITDYAGNLVAEGSTKIHVYPADAGAGKPLNVLVVGDSLTNASAYTAELVRLCKLDGNPALTLVGTNVPNQAMPENRHEGYGGWTARGFCTMWAKTLDPANTRRQRSPFLYEKDGAPVLDFQKYCDENNGGKAPDIITILLGCNDNFGAKDETIEASIDDFLKYMDVLIKEFHRVRPDTKIAVISLLPPAATQDAFGTNYGCNQTRWQYRKNQHRVLERTFATFSGREAENIYLVPAYVNLDCVNNYPILKAPANARSDQTIIRLNNGVHPAAPGYFQLADSIYCWLKGQLAAQ